MRSTDISVNVIEIIFTFRICFYHSLSFSSIPISALHFRYTLGYEMRRNLSLWICFQEDLHLHSFFVLFWQHMRLITKVFLILKIMYIMKLRRILLLKMVMRMMNWQKILENKISVAKIWKTHLSKFMNTFKNKQIINFSRE